MKHIESMVVMVLIKAGEGDTEDVYIVRSREELQRKIAADMDGAFEQYEKDSLLAMLDKHTNWGHGRYVLANIEPQWQQWTLVIENIQDDLRFQI